MLVTAGGALMSTKSTTRLDSAMSQAAGSLLPFACPSFKLSLHRIHHAYIECSAVCLRYAELNCATRLHMQAQTKRMGANNSCMRLHTVIQLPMNMRVSSKPVFSVGKHSEDSQK
eukprot:2315378-Amphidinium_carterae.1